MVAPRGFEPRLLGPEPSVLPLDEGAMVLLSRIELDLPAYETSEMTITSLVA